MNISDIIEPKPSEELIIKEEKMWNVKLPISYREFIINNNGGIPEKRSFLCNNHEYVIDRFLCILEKTENNVYGSYDIDVVLTQIEDRLTDNEDLIGCELLPIAQLFAGDYLCINFNNGNSEPSICVWSHEESGELEPVFYNLFEIFNEFLKKIY